MTRPHGARHCVSKNRKPDSKKIRKAFYKHAGTPKRRNPAPVSDHLLKLRRFALDNRSAFTPTSRPADQPFGQSGGRAVGRSVVRAVGRSGGRSFGRSIVRAVNRSVVRSFGRSVVRAVGRSVVRAVGRSVVRSFGRSVVRAPLFKKKKIFAHSVRSTATKRNSDGGTWRRCDGGAVQRKLRGGPSSAPQRSGKNKSEK